MRHIFITSILAAASMVTILPSLANAAPPNSMFRQSFMANQQALMARQQTLISNQQSINQQLINNAQRNVANLDRGLLNRSIQRNREAPLAALNRSQNLIAASNVARLSNTAMSAQANFLGIPAISNTFGTFPSSTFFNPSAYASMYGLSFNGGLIGSSAFTGFPSTSFGGFPSSGFVAPTSVTGVP